MPKVPPARAGRSAPSRKRGRQSAEGKAAERAPRAKRGGSAPVSFVGIHSQLCAPKQAESSSCAATMPRQHGHDLKRISAARNITQVLLQAQRQQPKKKLAQMPSQSPKCVGCRSTPGQAMQETAEACRMLSTLSHRKLQLADR